ncbi:MAG: Mur ligase family protein [Candidatus Moraniibacteriota bacterium]
MKRLFKFFVERYLRLITKVILWRHKPMVVSVAGTTNKTFIKNQILKELAEKDNIRGNPRSFNTEIGLPLAILFLPSGSSSIFKWCDILITGTFIAFFSRKFPKVLVLEMGVDKKGDMKYLLSIVKPDIAVISNVDKSFPGNDCSRDVLAQEMKLLAKAIPEKGSVILNADDVRVKKIAKAANSRVILFGKDKDADAKIKNVRRIASGESFTLDFQKIEKNIKIDTYGKHNISAYVAAKIASREIEKWLKMKRSEK